MNANPSQPSGTKDLLHALLDANLQLPPEYRDHLTNHMPMALYALQSLGASPERLQEFYTRYARRFQGLPAPVAVPAPAGTDWRALRGQDHAYSELLAYFTDLVGRQSVEETLRLVLPDLMSGVAAAAFHGAIRTAYAVKAGHAGELAAGLTYWAWRWQALETPPVADNVLAFEPWAARLLQESTDWRSDGPLISIRMDEASRSEVYRALAGALVPATSLAGRIAELSTLAVDRYSANPNFTVLHMVTGLWALRTLSPWIADTEAAQTILAHNFVAAYMAAHVKPRPVPPAMPTQNWDAVIAAAIASDDDHVIKLVHACREEAAAYGEGKYLRAATLVTSM